MSCLHALVRSMWVVVSLATGSALAVCQNDTDQPIAPAPGSSIPANAPVFVARVPLLFVELEREGVTQRKTYVVEPLRRYRDGGEEPLSLVRVEDESSPLRTMHFDAGTLVEGESFSLGERDGARVYVGPAAPLPARIGTLAFGPPHERRIGCDDAALPPAGVSREVFLNLSYDVDPWRALARARVRVPEDGDAVSFLSWKPYGQLLATPGELGTSIGMVWLDCSRPSRQEVPVTVVLEVAGADTQPPPLTTTLVLDCADLPSRGCSTGLGLTPALLVLALIRRRRL